MKRAVRVPVAEARVAAAYAAAVGSEYSLGSGDPGSWRRHVRHGIAAKGGRSGSSLGVGIVGCYRFGWCDWLFHSWVDGLE